MIDLPPDLRRTPRSRRKLLVCDRTATSRAARTAIDLSAGGMRLVVAAEHAVGAIVAYDLYLGDRPQPMRVSGEILTSRGGATGVRFIGLETPDCERIAAFVNVA